MRDFLQASPERLFKGLTLLLRPSTVIERLTTVDFIQGPPKAIRPIKRASDRMSRAISVWFDTFATQTCTLKMGNSSAESFDRQDLGSVVFRASSSIPSCTSASLTFVVS